MKYGKIVAGRFVERLNRFEANVLIDGEPHTVHVKNTGRCKELLVPGATVYLEYCEKLTRKTQFDLVAVEKARAKKGILLVNMDSQAPNAVAEEWLREGNLFSPDAVVQREKTYRSSRFDFYVRDGERRAYIEIKGVTLENEGKARFPDAPTERGVKHLCELTECLSEGYEAFLIFVLQMGEMRSFSPNEETDRAFALALRKAAEAGVKVLAYQCEVAPDTLRMTQPIPVKLY